MGPVFSFIGAVFVGAASSATLGYKVAVTIARFALLSIASKFLTPKIDLQQTARDKLFTVKSSIQPQAFVYGQDMLSGPLIFSNVSGGNNQYLHRLVALTGREIDDIVALRIDDEDIAIGTGEDLLTRNADVTGGKFEDVMTVATELGTSTQTVLTQLNTDFSTLWTSAHRARGWALLYVRCEIVPDNTAYERGAPSNLKALVNGHKVYDPRLDSTQTGLTPAGSGAHRLATPSTWEWSDNPALCLADWLMWDQVGMGEESDRIDWQLVVDAADICDETVTIPPASPTTTQARYTCNFTFFADQERGQIKDILESAMLGRCIYQQGKWRMWAGAALTATATLTEENLAGGITIEASTASVNRYNTVRGKFVDPTRDYHAAAYPEQTNSSYVTDDNGEVKYKTIDFNACNNSYECQRNAIISNRKSRNQVIIRWSGNWSCFRLQTGHVVNVTLDEPGFTAKKFMITEWSLDAQGNGVELTLVEENDSVWTDPAVGDYTTRSETGELIPPDEVEPVYVSSVGSWLSFEGTVTAQNLAKSSYDTGDLLLVFNAGASQMPISAPTGWNRYDDGQGVAIFGRIATGDSNDEFAIPLTTADGQSGGMFQMATVKGLSDWTVPAGGGGTDYTERDQDLVYPALSAGTYTDTLVFLLIYKEWGTGGKDPYPVGGIAQPAPDASTNFQAVSDFQYVDGEDREIVGWWAWRFDRGDPVAVSEGSLDQTPEDDTAALAGSCYCITMRIRDNP